MLTEFLLSFIYASSIEGCPLLAGKRDLRNVIQLCLHETRSCFGEKKQLPYRWLITTVKYGSIFFVKYVITAASEIT